MSSMKWIKENRKTYKWIATFPSDTPFFEESVIEEYKTRVKESESNLFFVKSNEKRHNIFGLWSTDLLEILEEDLIKNNLSISFGKGEDSSAVKLKTELESKGLVVDQKQDVHWQTLRGFVKEQIEKNKTIPSETFGLYIANRTKIKTNN